MSANAVGQKFHEYEIKVENLSSEADNRVRNSQSAHSLDDTAETGVSVYKRLRRAEPETFEESKELYEMCIAWHQDTSAVLRAIDDLEHAPQGVKVFSADELRAAFHEASTFIDRLKGRIAALDEFIAGNGIPAETFVDGL